MGPIASGITKLANLVHRQVLRDERHVVNLESLKDEFGIGTTAATTPGLLKAFLNVLYVRAALGYGSRTTRGRAAERLWQMT